MYSQFNLLPVSVVILNQDKQIIFANTRARELFLNLSTTISSKIGNDSKIMLSTILTPKSEIKYNKKLQKRPHQTQFTMQLECLAKDQSSFGSLWKCIRKESQIICVIQEFPVHTAISNENTSQNMIVDSSNCSSNSQLAILQNIMNTLPFSLFWKNKDLTYIGCNTKFAQEIGLPSPSAIVGKTDLDLFPQRLAQQYRHDDTMILQNHQPKLNYMEPLKRSQIQWYRVSKFPLTNQKGELFAILGIAEDISNIRNTQAEIKKLEKRILEAEKMESIGRLTGGIAHKFNNLLTAIQGYTDMIKLDIHTDQTEIKEYLDIIQTNLSQATDLTQQLLGFGRKGKFQPQILDINHILKKSLTKVNTQIDASITVQSDFSSVPILIEGEPTQLDTAFTNLFYNALESMPNGGTLSISTQIVSSHRLDDIRNLFIVEENPIYHQEYGRIQIKDTGIGISPEIQNKIFEPFFTTKKSKQKNGLGLPMVYGIVQTHKGNITIESQKQKGTLITLYFPLTEKLRKQDNYKSGQRLNPPDTIPTLLRGSGKILIIDDDKSIRRYLKHQLERLGYQVYTAATGREGIAIFSKSSIDLVLLDMIMPGLNGPQTFYKLHALDNDLKVIIISGFTQNNEVSKLITAGAISFIQKPFRIEKLSKLLNTALEIPEKH